MIYDNGITQHGMTINMSGDIITGNNNPIRTHASFAIEILRKQQERNNTFLSSDWVLKRVVY